LGSLPASDEIPRYFLSEFRRRGDVVELGEEEERTAL